VGQLVVAEKIFTATGVQTARSLFCM